MWLRALLLFCLSSAPAFADAGGGGILKSAAGATETFDACTSCHSERIIAQQGLTREGWEETLRWMVDEQEMAPLDETQRTRILDYLSTHYNTDRPNRP